MVGRSFVGRFQELIECCIGDGAEFTRFDGTVYDLYRREQAGWDEVRSS
jgi:hypothetical protein